MRAEEEVGPAEWSGRRRAARRFGGTVARRLLGLAAVAGCTTLGVPTPAEPLVGSLQVFTVGGDVGFVLQITNSSDRPVDVTLPTGQTFDFFVESGGEEVWRWSADQVFTQAVRRERFAPGESRRFEASWTPPPTARGEYVATGVLTASDHTVRQSIRFTLP